MRSSPTLRALWQLRALSLFTLGPALGVVLVDLIFGLPVALRWQAGGMGLLMAGLFLFLFLRVRAEFLRDYRDRTLLVETDTRHCKRVPGIAPQEDATEPGEE